MTRMSAKKDIGIMIGMIYLDRGMSLDETREEVKKLQRKTVSDMRAVYNDLKKEK